MAGRRLTEDEAAAVLRRAAELDDARGSTDATGLERAALERAAVEVGIAPSSVQQALAELEAGRLVAQRGSRWRWRPGVATVERDLDVTADRARHALDAYLRRQMLRPVRRRAAVSVWESASGLTATVLRRTDLSGRLRLKPVSQLTLCVVDREGGGCHVRIDLDFSEERSEHRWMAGVGTVIGAAVVAGGVIGAISGTEVALAAVPGGASLAGVTWFGASSAYASAVGRSISSVELALDDLE